MFETQGIVVEAGTKSWWLPLFTDLDILGEACWVDGDHLHSFTFFSISWRAVTSSPKSLLLGVLDSRAPFRRRDCRSPSV